MNTSSILSPKQSKPKKKTTRSKPSPLPPVNEPPLVLDTKMLAHMGIRVLQVRFPMLPSINRQYKVARGRMYTDPDYKDAKDRARLLIEQQVKAMGWQISDQDLYWMVFDFAFTGETDADSDGPIKASMDANQELSPKEQRAMGLVTQAMIDAWNEQHPSAIKNDGQVMQIQIIKQINQSRPMCTVTIYACDRSLFPVVPTHTLFHNYFVSSMLTLIAQAQAQAQAKGTTTHGTT